MQRRDALKLFAEKLGHLEREYKVTIMSDNGFNNAIVIDCMNQHTYDYHRNKGLLSPNENDLDIWNEEDEYL